MFVTRLALITVALIVPCVAAPINAALVANGSLVAQSSTGFGMLASLAADGIVDGNVDNGSVSSTGNEPGAWWQVTFSESYIFSAINIYNRTDGQGDLINPFSVFLFDTNGVAVWSSEHNTITSPAGVAAFSGINVQAKSLKVQLEGSNYLQLAEVQAWTADTAEVPESSTYALMAGGLAAFGLLRRRKK